MPRPARAARNLRRRLRQALRRLPFGQGGGENVQRRQGELRHVSYAESRAAGRARPLHGSPDSDCPPRRFLPERMSEMPIPNRRSKQWSRRELLLAGVSGLALRNARAQQRPVFEEIPPDRSGIRWVHDNGASAEHYLPETMGPGCAFLDYDNDGWMDIYLVNSGPSDFYKPKRPIRNALYKNNRDGTFTDVTEKAGVAGGTFGMGVAIGDYDNDGWPDIFVTSYGNCILYRNNRDGTFTDVTRKAGLLTPGWTTSAVWFDYDNDGKLDLFLCSFVDYGPTAHRNCGENKLGRNYYCIPRFFKGTPSFLYHNNGDGTF